MKNTPKILAVSTWLKENNSGMLMRHVRAKWDSLLFSKSFQKLIVHELTAPGNILFTVYYWLVNQVFLAPVVKMAYLDFLEEVARKERVEITDPLDGLEQMEQLVTKVNQDLQEVRDLR